MLPVRQCSSSRSRGPFSTHLPLCCLRAVGVQAQRAQASDSVWSVTVRSRLRRAHQERDWRAALQIWHLQQGQEEADGAASRGLDGTSYTIVLGAMARAGLASEAATVLQRMMKACLHPNHAAIGSAVSACVAGGAWEESHRLLLMAEDWLHGAGAVAYNAVIGACGRAHSAEAALRVLSRMSVCRVARTTVTYGAAIGACGRGQDWEAALHLLTEMRDCGSVSPGRKRVLGIDSVAHAAAVAACCQAVAWRHALALVEDAGTEWSRSGAAEVAPVAYTSAIAACDRASFWERAVATLVGMPAASLCPETFAYNSALSACGRSSEWAVALALWDRMGDDAQPDRATAGILVQACERAGCWAVALALFEKLSHTSSIELGTQAHNAVISACALGRQWPNAIALLRKMSEGGVPMTRTTKNAALRACEGHTVGSTLALSLLREGIGASASPRWREQNIPKRAEITAMALSHAASQIELRMTSSGDFVDGVPAITWPTLQPLLRSPPMAGGGGCEEPLSSAVLATLADALGSDVVRPCVGSSGSAGPVCLENLEGAALRYAIQTEAEALFGADTVHVHLVGSRLYGAALPGSDVDLIVELSAVAQASLQPDVGEQHLIAKDGARLVAISALLRFHRHIVEAAETMETPWRVSGLVLDASRPILCLKHCGEKSGGGGSTTAVQVSFDQSLMALRKSELLAKCSEHDPRPLQLARLVRLWAQVRCMSGQQEGYPSGFAWCLLAIFYCQCRGMLGGLTPKELRTESASSSTLPGGVLLPGASSELPGMDLEACAMAISLLPGFFAFFAREFRWSQEVVAVRLGHRALRIAGECAAPGMGLATLSVEDPVEPNVDLAAPYLNLYRDARLRAEFRRADRQLRGSCAADASRWVAVFRGRPRFLGKGKL